MVDGILDDTQQTEFCMQYKSMQQLVVRNFRKSENMVLISGLNFIQFQGNFKELGGVLSKVGMQ